MDVIAAFSANLPFALASQGTSFTIPQLKALKQATKTVWLAFDNDSAGKMASKKFFKLATQIGLNVMKVIIPKELKDLDDLSCTIDRSTFSEDKLQVKPFLEYLIFDYQEQLNSTNSDTQKQAIMEIMDLFSVLDELGKEQYLKKLSQTANISLTTLNSLMDKIQTEQDKFSKRQPLDANDAPATIIIERNPEFDNILTIWQKLCSITNYDPAIIEEHKLENIYLLLKKLIGDRLGEPNLADYLDHYKDSLDLIKQNMQGSEPNVEMVAKAVMQFIDQNLSKLLLDENLKDVYLKIKTK